MESSRQVLEREIKELEVERQPVAAELARIDAELKKRRASLAHLMGDMPIEDRSPAPAKEVWVAAREILEKHGSPGMPKDELSPMLEGCGYSKQRIGISLAVSTKPSPSGSKLTRSGKGEKIAKHEIIGLPEWQKPKK
jgi:hypothetical protein